LVSFSEFRDEYEEIALNGSMLSKLKTKIKDDDEFQLLTKMENLVFFVVLLCAKKIPMFFGAKFFIFKNNNFLFPF